ncbi:MAG: hypothetical protein AAFX99_26730, partial [Myxococcota bacterium]
IYEPVTVPPFHPIITVHLHHHALPDGTLQVPRAETPSATAEHMARLLGESLKPNIASSSRTQTALTWTRNTTPSAAPSEQGGGGHRSVRLRPRYLQPLTDTTHPNPRKALLGRVRWVVGIVVLGCVAAFALSGVWRSGDELFDTFFVYAFFVGPSVTAFTGSVFGLAHLPRLKARPMEQAVSPEYRLTLEGHQLRLTDHAQPVTIDLEQPFDVVLSRSTTEAGSWVHIDVRSFGTPSTDTPSITPQRLRLSVPSEEPPEAMPELEVRGFVIEPEAVTGWLWPTLEHFAQAQGRSLTWRPE